LTGCVVSESENVSGVSQGTVSNPRIVYTPYHNATPETELSALAAAYRFIVDCHAQKIPTPEPDGRNDDAIVRDTEEVSHVEQRPDRPSENT
jgi:hypothetical protein